MNRLVAVLRIGFDQQFPIMIHPISGIVPILRRLGVPRGALIKCLVIPFTPPFSSNDLYIKEIFENSACTAT